MTTFSELPEDILRLCQAGDLDATMKFIKHYERPVHYFLWRNLGRGPHVDDLAQETFDRAIRALPRFDLSRGEGVWPWLRTIASNLVKDWKKKRANSETPFDNLEELLSLRSGTTPENEACLVELRCAIQYAIEKLDDRSREVFELAALDGSSVKDIARRLNMAEGTVKSRHSRAREFLRELLKEWAGWVP